MPSPYTVTIRPGFVAEGEHKGNLEFLHFSATDGSNIWKWWYANTGMLETELRFLFWEWSPGWSNAFVMERR